MSGRIALMVRGLPSIPIEDAVERFSKYYTKPQNKVFHSSESFPKAESVFGEISFVGKDGTTQGGTGLTKEAIRDLRKLKEDFEGFVVENPSIYTNYPTSRSRRNLYSRMGFEGSDLQALDARRITSQDLPYTQVLDPNILPTNTVEALGIQPRQGFIKTQDGTVRSLQRFAPSLNNLFSGKVPKESALDLLELELTRSLVDQNKQKEKKIRETLRGTPQFMDRLVAQGRRTSALQEQEANMYSRMSNILSP